MKIGVGSAEHNQEHHDKYDKWYENARDIPAITADCRITLFDGPNLHENFDYLDNIAANFSVWHRFHGDIPCKPLKYDTEIFDNTALDWDDTEYMDVNQRTYLRELVAVAYLEDGTDNGYNWFIKHPSESTVHIMNSTDEEKLRFNAFDNEECIIPAYNAFKHRMLDRIIADTEGTDNAVSFAFCDVLVTETTYDDLCSPNIKPKVYYLDLE